MAKKKAPTTEAPETVLVLRTVNADGTSHGGFQWPLEVGANGAIALAWHDADRPRIAVGYVGEGLEADTWYRLSDKGEFEVVS